MKEVLDVGAGRFVCPGATRAIDPLKKYILSTQKMKGDIMRPKSLHEYRQASAEKIPYPDNFFTKVVSRWALGFCIYQRRAYQEIARVLKPGGRIEVRLLWKDRRYKKNLLLRLQEVGFDIYTEYKGVYSNGHQTTEFIICGRLSKEKADG